MTTQDSTRILDHIELHDRGEARMAAKSGVVLYVDGGLTGVDNGGTTGLPIKESAYVQHDLTAGDAPAPSVRGHVVAHDGTGASPAGLYESDPDNSQWSGLGLAAGNTIGY